MEECRGSFLIIHLPLFLPPGCLLRSVIQVLNCLDTLGKLPWPRSALGDVWQAVQVRYPVFRRGGCGGIEEGN